MAAEFSGTVLKRYDSVSEKIYVIPDGTTEIAERAFYLHGVDQDELEEIVIPDSVRVIGNGAFMGREKLVRINIPDGVRYIPVCAFDGCKALEEINLEHIQTFGDNAFHLCEKLKSVELHASRIAKDAFFGCTNLSAVTLVGTKRIEDLAFGNCSNLKHIVLPEGLMYIGNLAFDDSGLTEVTVPKTVREVSAMSFHGCREITVYDTIEPDARPYDRLWDNKSGKYISNVGVIGNKVSPYIEWIDHEIIVRNAQTNEIKYKVWMGSDPEQSGYKNTLASSWGRNATFNFAAQDAYFSRINGSSNKIRVAINRIRYPINLSDEQKASYIAYLVRIAKDLVSECIDKGDMETLLFCEPFGVLKKNNIDYLLDYAVKKKAVEFSAYLMQYKVLHFKNSTPRKPTLASTFKEIEIWGTSRTDLSKVGRYKGNDTDVVFPSEVKGKAITGVAGTSSAVPDNYRAIVSVVLPEGYTSIGDCAFYGCENLEKIVLPSTLQFIGKEAFKGCKKLKKMVMPDSVTEIGKNSFRDCISLEEVKFSNNLSVIPEDAFKGCEKLKEVVMPDSVTEIGKNSFRHCASLEKVKFSNNLSVIPEYAFADCSSLGEVDLPGGITEVCDGCFKSSGGPKKVAIHGARMYACSGWCGTAATVYAYKGASKYIGGFSDSKICELKLVDIPSETFVALIISFSDGQEDKFSFYAESSIGTIQKNRVSALDRKIKEAANGATLAEVLADAYGRDFVLASNNDEDIKRMCALAFEKPINEIVITEKKENIDGCVTTIYTFSAEEQKGTMKERELIRYKNDYYSKITGFIDIGVRRERIDTGVWDFTNIESIEFQDKIFVLTGFNVVEEEKVTQEITSRGGVVKSSTVAKTDYLIVMEEHYPQTTKYKRAKELQKQGKNIAIISSGMFYDFIDGM